MWNLHSIGLSMIITFLVSVASADDISPQVPSVNSSTVIREQQEAVIDFLLRKQHAALWKNGKAECMNFEEYCAEQRDEWMSTNNA